MSLGTSKKEKKWAQESIEIENPIKRKRKESKWGVLLAFLFQIDIKRIIVCVLEFSITLQHTRVHRTLSHCMDPMHQTRVNICP